MCGGLGEGNVVPRTDEAIALTSSVWQACDTRSMLGNTSIPKLLGLKTLAIATWHSRVSSGHFFRCYLESY